MIQPNLKTGTVTYRDMDFAITELSARAFAEVWDLQNEHGTSDPRVAAATCRYGVNGWHEYSLDEILDTQPYSLLVELAGDIMALGDPDPNSASDPDADSSSASLPH